MPQRPHPHPGQHFGRKTLLLSSLITLASNPGIGLAQNINNPVASQHATAFSLSIAPGSLTDALNSLGEKTGILLSYPPDLAQGLQSRGLSGTYTTEQALTELLRGTELQIVQLSAQSYRLQKYTVRQASVADRTSLPTTTVRSSFLTADEIGHNNVYNENVTSVYQGREELQRFQVTNPGDVFKGMNGVYSMDTRSSQAITPQYPWYFR